MEARPTRPAGPSAWLVALGASLAVHLAVGLAVFGTASRVAPPRPSAVPARVTFRVAVVSARPGPAPGAASAPGSRPAAPARAAPPLPPARIAPGPAPASSGPPAAPESDGPEGPPGLAETSGVAGSEASPGGGGGAAGVQDADALLLAAVHQRLRDAAVQCSPAAARRFGGRGEVLLSFCLAATGAVDRVEVLRTSGLTVLDEAATGCVVPRGAPYPAAASGRCFQVPVRF